MSRQNKSKKVIARRVQITAVHRKAVESTGLKRTRQPFGGRMVIGFTKKLTSANKGTCKIVGEKNSLRRVSASTPSRRNDSE